LTATRLIDLRISTFKAYGINDVQDIVHNPSYDMLFQEELDPNLEGYELEILRG
jgi:ATP-dependent phosphoenolpyruvate carboxykinase